MTARGSEGRDMENLAQIKVRVWPTDDDDDLVLFVAIMQQDGPWLPVAKRRGGQTWIALEPGYTVRGCEPGASKCFIEIEHDGKRMRFVRQKKTTP
jgi:hypothetical protein